MSCTEFYFSESLSISCLRRFRKKRGKKEEKKIVKLFSVSWPNKKKKKRQNICNLSILSCHSASHSLDVCGKNGALDWIGLH